MQLHGAGAAVSVRPRWQPSQARPLSSIFSLRPQVPHVSSARPLPPAPPALCVLAAPREAADGSRPLSRSRSFRAHVGPGAGGGGVRAATTRGQGPGKAGRAGLRRHVSTRRAARSPPAAERAAAGSDGSGSPRQLQSAPAARGPAFTWLLPEPRVTPQCCVMSACPPLSFIFLHLTLENWGLCASGLKTAREASCFLLGASLLVFSLFIWDFVSSKKLAKYKRKQKAAV